MAQRQVYPFDRAIFDDVEQQFYCLDADFVHRLADGRQSRLGVLGQAQVIETGHRHIAWAAQTRATQCMDGAECHVVTEAEEGGWPVRALDQFRGAGNTGFDRVIAIDDLHVRESQRPGRL